jgi:hypothetical protein
MKWSTHSCRIDPINRSAKPFCQGEAGAVGLSRMPMPGGITVEIAGRLNALLGEQAYPNKGSGSVG